MFQFFQPAVLLLVCGVWTILETARGVYSSKNEEKQTDLHMASTRRRHIMHVIVHNLHFRRCSQQLELPFTDV